MLRIGDMLILVLLAASLWLLQAKLADSSSASYVEITQDGQITGQYPLRLDKTLRLHSDAGDTVIQINNGRVRIAQSPGKYQYCVKQGWLSAAGALAICMPSRISLRLIGNATAEDSLAY